MARLPRLVLPGCGHLVVQRGHDGRSVFADDEDRRAFVAALREAAAAHRVAIHAYALADAEVQIVATPPAEDALGRMMQALGRRYVAAYRQRHGGRGTLWDGRYRCAPVEPGAWLLAALRLVDAAAPWSSAAHRTGGRDPLVVDPPEVWQLGNTPFEREAAYRRLLETGVAPAEAAALREAALGGWAAGGPAFLARLGEQTSRPLRPRPRGRPPRPAPARPLN
ncbi:transposase [Rubrivivax gelatinosus]|uniref:Putative transposase n=1 Tax=Rubrivivax gelatinosus TaxID=28068 RepID=A0A4R2MXJ0_RUBGE|nr:transposase [Rubrivivax gelatinosus]MBK1686781.1 transposase [Rubrivivax gelatinosus]TCP05193.1 putative transposase [Rubrivivax gelatinosus]